jgi:uncharacterized repeat protein (TIGR01451 family)
MQTSIFQRTRGPQPITRFYTGFRRFGALVAFITMLAATFYSASSASVSSKRARHLTDSNSTALSKTVVDAKAVGTNSKDATAGMRRGNTPSNAATAWLSPLLMPQAAGESIATFASDCTTPKTSFVLGETVCIQVVGAPFGSEVQRRISWVGPDGVILRLSDITDNPQSDSFEIPNSATIVLGESTLNTRGTWRINTIASEDAGLRSEAFFSVSDPANAATDLSVEVNKFGGVSSAPAGGNIAFTLEVANNGPDAATSVELRNPVPDNTTFVSIVQTAGPTFSCVDPGAGNTGTTVCSIAGLARDETATFTVIYQVNAGTPEKTVLLDSASITNGVAELRSPDNAGADVATVGPSGCVVTCPADITMGNDQDAYGATVNYPSQATGLGTCGTIETTPASGTFFPVGTTTVTASGSSGSPCSFNVTINDTQAPAISCPADITTHESSSGSGSAIVNYAPPSVTENDPAGAPVTCDHPSGSSFPVGETIVTCTATDAAGNTSQPCSFKVTVEGDASNCSLSCPADITVDAEDGQCGAHVTYPDATASTECGTVSYSKPSGDLFPVGTTTVTVTTTAGRSCSFRVKVEDKQEPTITPPANKEVSAGATSCEVAVNPGTATATDNCSSGLTVKGVRDDGDPLNAPYPVGTTTITWTATDASGNTKSADQTIRVKDTVAPVVNLVPSITLTAPADTCQVEVPEVLDLQSSIEGRYGTASDNCAGPDRLTIVQRPAAGTLVSAGDLTITVTVYDGDPDDPDAPTPNKTEKTTILHVIDNTPPTIALNGANPMTVECHTGFTDPGATATDACAGSFAATPSGSVDANTPGTYTITYNATDPSGNAATPVARTVNVVDTTPPTINCPANITVTLPLHSTAVSMPVSYTVTASDSCSSNVNVTSSPASGSIFPVGTTVVNATATDAAGNTSSCSFTVTVLYNFTGFFQPVDNLPTLNMVNAGRAIPVKFSLSGNKGLNIFASGYPASGVIACSSSAPVNEVEETVTAGSSSLSYDAGSDQYIYIWKTNSAWAGTCRQLIIQLNDGSFHRANFKFR